MAPARRLFMRSRFGMTALLLSLASAIIASGCGTPGNKANRVTLPVARQDYTTDTKPNQKMLGAIGFQYYWKNETGLPLRAGEDIQGLFLRDENLYLVSSFNDAYACDAQVGTYKWLANVAPIEETLFDPVNIPEAHLTRELGDNDMLLHPPAISSIPAFPASIFCTGSRITVVNRDNGVIYRNYPFKQFASMCRAATTPDGIYVCAASPNKLLYGIDLLCGVKTATVEIKAQVKAPPCIYGEYLYIGTRDSRILKISVGAEMNIARTLELRGPVLHQFHVDGRGVFVAAEDKRFYGLNPITLEHMYTSIYLGGRPAGPMQIGQTLAFQRVHGHGIQAIDFLKGKKLWSKSNGIKVIGVDANEVWILDKSRNLLIVEAQSGRQKQSAPIRGFDFYASNTITPAIYTATEDGKFFCITKKKKGYINLEQLEAIKNKLDKDSR